MTHSPASSSKSITFTRLDRRGTRPKVRPLASEKPQSCAESGSRSPSVHASFRCQNPGLPVVALAELSRHRVEGSDEARLLQHRASLRRAPTRQPPPRPRHDRTCRDHGVGGRPGGRPIALLLFRGRLSGEKGCALGFYLSRGAQKNPAPLPPPQKPACAAGRLITQRKPLGPATVCGPTTPGRGFFFVSALTDFIATAHDLAGSALTL